MWGNLHPHLDRPCAAGNGTREEERGFGNKIKHPIGCWLYDLLPAARRTSISGWRGPRPQSFSSGRQTLHLAFRCAAFLSFGRWDDKRPSGKGTLSFNVSVMHAYHSWRAEMNSCHRWKPKQSGDGGGGAVFSYGVIVRVAALSSDQGHIGGKQHRCCWAVWLDIRSLRGKWEVINNLCVCAGAVNFYWPWCTLMTT